MAGFKNLDYLNEWNMKTLGQLRGQWKDHPVSKERLDRNGNVVERFVCLVFVFGLSNGPWELLYACVLLHHCVFTRPWAPDKRLSTNLLLVNKSWRAPVHRLFLKSYVSCIIEKSFRGQTLTSKLGSLMHTDYSKAGLLISFLFPPSY